MKNYRFVTSDYKQQIICRDKIYLIPGKDYQYALKYSQFRIILVNPPEDLDLTPFYGLYFSDQHFTIQNLSYAKELIFEGTHNIGSLYLPACLRLTCRRCAKLTTIQAERLGYLKVEDCPSITEITVKDLRRVKIVNCPYLDNFNFLSGADKVTLRDVAISNSKLLSHSKTVKCSSCHNLRSVWPLANVDKLSLLNCHFISDISTLTGVRYLDISRSFRIKNIPRPHKFETFIAVGCHGITDVSNLAGVKEVNLSFCNFLTDLTGLERCQKVTLDFCDSLTNVEKLARVPDVSLQHCPNRINVSALRNCQRLNLSYSPEIIGLSYVRKVPKLIIEDYIFYQN